MSGNNSSLEPKFPLEFIVAGTPVSNQSARPAAKSQWKGRVKTASAAALQEGYWAYEGRVAVTMFYFPAAAMRGDIDNIVKPVLDALSRHIYMDDHQVNRVVVQKFEPGSVFPFRAPTPALADALTMAKPVLFVRLSDDPFEELK